MLDDSQGETAHTLCAPMNALSLLCLYHILLYPHIPTLACRLLTTSTTAYVAYGSKPSAFACCQLYECPYPFLLPHTTSALLAVFFHPFLYHMVVVLYDICLGMETQCMWYNAFRLVYCLLPTYHGA